MSPPFRGWRHFAFPLVSILQSQNHVRRYACMPVWLYVTPNDYHSLKANSFDQNFVKLGHII